MEITQLTGFRDIGCMLHYAAILCGGNLELFTNTTTTLTSIKEWLFYFTFTYGRAAKWLDDASKIFWVEKWALRCIVRKKLALELNTRFPWPLYASWEEDMTHRDESWEIIFPRGKDIHVIMHDMTNLPLMKARWVDLHWALFNNYYGGCVGKGGVFSQCWRKLRNGRRTDFR